MKKSIGCTLGPIISTSFFLVFLAACSQSTPGSSPNISNNSANTGVAAFQTTFYPFAVTNCAQCHNGSVSGAPAFASSDVNTAYAAALPLANLSTPSMSTIATYAGNGHCGVSNCQNNSAAAISAISAWALAAAASNAPSGPSAAQISAFQTTYYPFATTACYQCHTSSSQYPAGNLPLFAATNVQSAYAEANSLIDFNDIANSPLVTYASNGHCNAPVMEFNCTDNSGPALTAAMAWAAANGVSVAGTPVRATLMSDQQALELITTDLLSQTTANRPFQLYFTLEAWGNTNGQPVNVSVGTERAALIKMLNLTSTGTKIVQPVAVDPYALIYRVDARSLNWTVCPPNTPNTKTANLAGQTPPTTNNGTVCSWNNLKNTDPYFAIADFPVNSSAILNPSNTSVIPNAVYQTMRADWYVNNVAYGAVDAYFNFLGIDSADPQIDALNGVNRFADMAVGYPATVRAGFASSLPETFNRDITWHQTTSLGSGAQGSGYLFKSYNHDSDNPPSNIFSNPYEPVENNPNPSASPYPASVNFVYFDSDSVSSLPNGLNFFYTVEGHDGQFNGQVMNVGASGTSFIGPTVCLQCHDTNTNVFMVHDEVNASLSLLPNTAFGPNTASLMTLLLGMYNETAINEKIAAAGKTYQAAYAALNLPVVEVAGLGTEVTNIVSNNYTYVVSTEMTAAELGVSPAQMIAAIKSSTPAELALSSLLTVDQNGNYNGVVRRDTWELYYPSIRSLLFPKSSSGMPAVPVPPVVAPPQPTPTH